MARGRRVNSNGEKSKQLLLEKAMDLFSSNGYHQTKISDIVKLANLTQPTFYLYFQSKEILFNDLNEQFRNDLFSIFKVNQFDEHSGGKDFTTTIKQMLTDIFVYFVGNPKLTKIGFYESEQSEQVKTELGSKIANILKYAANDYDVEVHTLAQSLLGSIERLTLSNLLTHESQPEQLAYDIVKIYFVNQKQLVR